MENTDRSETGHVLWACVEEGFHVGSRDGNFLGYVDRQPDGSYRAFDARSTVLGDFPQLSDATSAVSGATRSDHDDDLLGMTL